MSDPLFKARKAQASPSLSQAPSAPLNAAIFGSSARACGKVSVGCRKNAARLALLVAALSFSLAACECGPAVSNVKPSLEVEGESLDFGPVAIGSESSRSITIRSASAANLELELKIEGDPGLFRFSEEPPDSLSGNSSLDLLLSFRPPEVGTFSGVLEISSNDPDPAKSTRRILLFGQGQEAKVELNPKELELVAFACPDSLTLPQCSAQESLQIKNVGEVPLLLESVQLEGANGETLAEGLSLLDSPENKELLPGASFQARIRWQPPPGADLAPPVNAQILVKSNDPEAEELYVPLRASAKGKPPPQVCLFVSRAERLEYREPPTPATYQEVPESEYLHETPEGLELRAQPGMRLYFDTRPPPLPDGSVPQACTQGSDGEELELEWELEKPQGSSARLSSKTRKESDFELDAAGNYRVKVRGIDAFGQSAEAEIEIDGIPRDDLFVQLTWPDPSDPSVVADLDLHLLRNSPDNLFCENDCFFGNPNPDWSVSGDSSARPRLLRDDQGTGSRFESISLPKAKAGDSFYVLVHNWAIEGAASHSLKPGILLRVRGEERNASSGESLDPAFSLERAGEFLQVARIDFLPDGEVEISKLSSLGQVGEGEEYQGDLLSCP